MKMQKGIKPEDIICQKSKGIIKNYIVVINGRKFYDQCINSDIKSYEEIRKLTTGPG